MTADRSNRRASATPELVDIVDRPAGGSTDPLRSLAETVAARLRERVVSGVLKPGSHLSEQALSDELEVSRNTLREVFRILAGEGLLRHEVHRGVFVSTPGVEAIIDLYKLRRFLECSTLAQAQPRHPGTKAMRAAVVDALRCRDAENWLGVGSADIAFHAAIVDLADSPRLSSFYAQIALELRLVFGLLPDPEFLHGPFINENLAIVARLESGDPAGASKMLEAYLNRAERLILNAYTRATRSKLPSDGSRSEV